MNSDKPLAPKGQAGCWYVTVCWLGARDRGFAGWLTGATWRAAWTFPVGGERYTYCTDTCPVLGLSRSAGHPR
eukprot:2376409-Prymnesium_polylepis.2